MKRKDKIILAIILIVALFVALVTNAQEKKFSAMAGYKSLEIGYSYMDEESELIYGVSVAGVASDVAEKRANTNDKGKRHEFKGEIVPAVFGTIGAKFDRLNIIGKIGGSYVEQTINKEPTKDVFLALGLMVDYSVNDSLGFRIGYDSVSSVLVGVSFKIN